jgi:2-methylisocitrate lyase-like PEP mutase family enzyme
VGREPQTTRLRAMLDEGLVVAAGCYDPFTARLAQLAGFKAVHLSGMMHEVTQIGAPDLGIQTLTELAAQAARIADCIDVPIMADIDTGFGGVLNIRRTIREMERAGVAGVHMEDQTIPKRCPVLGGVRVVARQAAIDRIKAATDSRTDPGFVIVARSDAGETSLEEVIERCNLYLEAGADMAMPMFPSSYFGAAPDEQMAMIERACREIDGKVMAMGAPPPQGYTTNDFEKAGYSFMMFAGETLYAGANAVSELFSSIIETGNSTSYLQAHPGRYNDSTEAMNAVHLQKYKAFEDAHVHDNAVSSEVAGRRP